MKIAFYAPIRNEERMIEEFVNYHSQKMHPDDIFVFVDTGSTDSTVEKVKTLQEKGLPILLFDDYPQGHPLDFAFLRNFALGKVPKGFDVGIALDIDEMFVKDDWREHLDHIFSDGRKKVLIHQRWEDLSEETGIQGKHFIHQRSSIHSIAKDIKWKYPVHECLGFNQKKTKVETVKDLVTAHLRNTKKDRPSYKDIIREYLASKPRLAKADRMHVQYIYANELYVAHEHDEAIKEYRKYLKLTEDFSVDTMTEAYRNNIANACVKLAGMFAERKDALREGEYKAMAFSAKPCRETAVLLATWMATRGEYEAAMSLIRLGRSYTDKNRSYNVLDIFWESDRMDRIESLIQAGLDSRKEKADQSNVKTETASESHL